MTKAQKIMKYRGSGVSSIAVARIVGCNDGYVRAVWQRNGKSMRPCDTAFRERRSRELGQNYDTWLRRRRLAGTAAKAGAMS